MYLRVALLLFWALPAVAQTAGPLSVHSYTEASLTRPNPGTPAVHLSALDEERLNSVRFVIQRSVKLPAFDSWISPEGVLHAHVRRRFRRGGLSCSLSASPDSAIRVDSEPDSGYILNPLVSAQGHLTLPEDSHWKLTAPPVFSSDFRILSFELEYSPRYEARAPELAFLRTEAVGPIQIRCESEGRRTFAEITLHNLEKLTAFRIHEVRTRTHIIR